MKQLKICVELEAPLLSSGVANLALGVDAQQLVYQDQPVVPGSLVRGLLRHAWLDLNSIDETLGWPVGRWLGEEGRDKRGQLFFSHFYKVSAVNRTPHNSHNLIRISIDQDSGTAVPKMLKVINTCWPVGTKLKLEGEISYISGNTDSAEQLQRAVAKGLQWAAAIGAEKGVGFGHIDSVDVQPVDQGARASTHLNELNTAADRWCVSLKFEGPVCFAKPHDTERANRFDSQEHMPGAALLAVLNKRGVSSAVVDKLAATHLKTTAASAPIPMSWVYCDGNFFNAAGADGPFFLQSPEGQLRAPSFPVDWKNTEVALAEHQLSSHSRETSMRWLEVRTAIQLGSDRSEKSKLYSLNCVQAEPTDPWSGVIDISALNFDERQQVLNALATPLLGPFGKTDAMAVVDISVAENSQAVPASNSYCLMLSSDAALADASSCDAAKENYQNYWKSACAPLPVEMIDFYLDEYHGGGEYLYEQFGFSGEYYSPQIMARAGSVFVLRCTDEQRIDEFKTLIDKFIADGLPEPMHFVDHWRRKPWAHANGYGRVQLCPVPEAAEGWLIRPLSDSGTGAGAEI